MSGNMGRESVGCRRGPAQLREGNSGISAACMHGPPDQCSIAGRVWHCWTSAAPPGLGPI